MTLWLKLIKNDNYTCMKKKKRCNNLRNKVFGTLGVLLSAMMERLPLTVGNFASFWKPGMDTRTVLITAVKDTPGIQAKQFTVADWSTGEEFMTYACWLRPVTEVLIDMAARWDEAPQEVVVLEPAQAEAQPPAQATEGRARFASLSSAELDTLAGRRTSTNTDEQTKWGVKVFTGECTGAWWNRWRRSTE